MLRLNQLNKTVPTQIYFKYWFYWLFRRSRWTTPNSINIF